MEVVLNTCMWRLMTMIQAIALTLFDCLIDLIHSSFGPTGRGGSSSRSRSDKARPGPTLTVGRCTRQIPLQSASIVNCIDKSSSTGYLGTGVTDVIAY